MLVGGWTAWYEKYAQVNQLSQNIGENQKCKLAWLILVETWVDWTTESPMHCQKTMASRRLTICLERFRGTRCQRRTCAMLKGSTMESFGMGKHGKTEKFKASICIKSSFFCCFRHYFWEWRVDNTVPNLGYVYRKNCKRNSAPVNSSCSPS